MKRLFKWKNQIVLCLVALFLSSCSTIGGMVAERVKRPEVDFVDARINSLSFDSVGLLFDLRVRNPNSVGLRMAGFKYDFLINETSFLNGNQANSVEIAARGENTVQIPVSFGFLELYQTFQSLRDQDVSNYQFNCTLSFNVPVLGVVDIPLSKTGEIPMLKMPKISLDSLKLRSLNLSGADIRLRLKVNNPNAFAMILNGLQYQFDINESRWASGDMQEAIQITEKGEGLMEIPIRLDLVKMGQSVYQLLTRNEDLDYQFGGRLNLATSLPLLDKVLLPFDHSGQIKISR